MKFSPLARSISLGTLAVAMSLPLAAQAAFIEDSKASLELRNFYMNRDFRNSNSNVAPDPMNPALKTGRQSKAEEWAQGFLLRYESGFTEGTVGVGVDAYGFTGFKLDSGGGTAGTDLLLPKDHKGNVPSSYGELGAAAKFRISETTLRAGTLMPKLPVVSAGDARLLPQTFQGVQLTSLDVSNLTLNVGQLQRNNQRNSTNNEPLAIRLYKPIDKRDTSKYTKTNKNVSSKFNFFSGSYNWNDQLTTGYHYGQLDGVYKQHIVNGVYTLPIADGQSLKADLRYAKTSEDANSGIDNRAISGMLTYKLGYNSFGLGYQKMSGDTGYAYLAVTDPYLVNYVQYGLNFASADEKSWQARYDYNFAGLGMPGLSLMTRYITGDNIYMGAGKSRGNEWERDTDIAYVFQDGPLKNLGVKWRNATVRSDVHGKIDENRLIVSYTIPLL